MRLLLISVVLLHQLYAICDWDRLQKELAADRKSDAYNHGCRDCKEPVISTDACPESGYECDPSWTMTTNVLTRTDCACAEVRCLDKTAKLAVNGVFTDKLRCRNSQWTIGYDGNTTAESAVCAKYCDVSKCKDAHVNATADFSPLTVTPANAETKCATGTCAFGIAVMNEAGEFVKNLEGANSVLCKSDGLWSNGGEKYEYLMCNTPPCGPTVCPASNPGATGLLPLTVTHVAGQCAVATCVGGFVQLKADGSVVGLIKGVSSLTCGTNGKWAVPEVAEYESIMCAQPPCAYGCDETVVELHPDFLTPSTLPIRNGCAYSCPSGETLVFLGHPEDWSVPTMPSTKCVEGGRYSVNATYTTDKIGCRPCPFPDGEIPVMDPNAAPPVSKTCVATCTDADRKLYINGVWGDYFDAMIYPRSGPHWYDPVTGTDFYSQSPRCMVKS